LNGRTFQGWARDEDLVLITERLVEIVGEAARAMTAEGRAG
jgi:NTP pyrophosphatase (non-canonical NTP hydrolase)